MIFVLLLFIAKVYCIASYGLCGWILWKQRKDRASEEATGGEKVVASILFFVFAPIVVADVMWDRLRGTS